MAFLPFKNPKNIKLEAKEESPIGNAIHSSR